MTTYRQIAARLIRDGEGAVKVGHAHVVYDDATGKPIRAGDTLIGHPTLGFGRNLSGKGIEDDEAEVMEALERDILAGMGIPDPYV